MEENQLQTEAEMSEHGHLSWAQLTEAVSLALLDRDLRASELKNGELNIQPGFEDYQQILVLEPHFAQPKPWQVSLGLTRELLEDELADGELNPEHWDFQVLEPGAMLGLDKIPGQVSAIFGRLVSAVDGAPLTEMPLEDKLACLIYEPDPEKASHALVRIVILPDRVNRFLTLIYRHRDAASNIFERPDVLVERGATVIDRPTIYYALLDLAKTAEYGWR